MAHTDTVNSLNETINLSIDGGQVMGMGYGHGHGYRLRLHACRISIWGAPIPLSHFGCDESLMGCYAMLLAISHTYGDPLPKQQLIIAPRSYTAETLAKLDGCGNQASVYRNPCVPSFGLCHRLFKLAAKFG
jgi:hypothetical protein